MAISRRFFETAMRNPNKVAVIQDEKQLTYAGLLSLVQQQANILRLLLDERGDHIMVQLTGIDFVVMLLACADAGVCLVPIGKDATRETIAKAYEVCDCKFFINEGFAHTEERHNHRLKFQGQPEDNFLIITTSGSTGEPKPILLKQKTKLARVEMMNELYNCTAEDVTIISTALHHSMGQRLVLMSVLKGGTLVMMDDGWSVDRWHALVREHEVTFAVPVATQVKQIMVADEYLPSMTLMVSSSAPLAANDVGSVRRGYPLYNCYGTTEVSIATSGDYPRGSVGTSIPDVDIRIADDGEIQVRTPYLFDGYYNRADLTADAITFPDGYFKTGDIGRKDADGVLYYLGRTKELINVGGTKVYPQDVEAVVANMLGVIECAAFPHEDDALGEVVAVAVVLRPETTALEVDHADRLLQAFCLPHLTDAQLPRHVYVVRGLPKTETGKIQRGKLAEKFGGVK
jgi:acyl-coenzyme A synthetase/AMP-(fatty) acid ligase